MKLEIDISLLKKFKNYQEAKYILDFDHSLSRDHVSTDCCGITRYRLILVDDVTQIFDAQIQSNLGDVYFKDWGKMYLDENMKLHLLENGLIEFSSDNNTIAMNVQIFDFRDPD
jgi:uncharacterized protein YqkB